MCHSQRYEIQRNKSGMILNQGLTGGSWARKRKTGMNNTG